MTSIDQVLVDSVRSAVTDAVRDLLTEEQIDALTDRPLACTRDESARLLNVSVRMIDTWIAEGVLPRLPHTSKVLIPRRALIAFANGPAHQDAPALLHQPGA